MVGGIGLAYYARTEPRCVGSPRSLTVGLRLTTFSSHLLGVRSLLALSFERGILRRKLFFKSCLLKQSWALAPPFIYFLAGRRCKKQIPYFLAPKTNFVSGGRYRARTYDLLGVNETRSQLRQPPLTLP